MTGRCEPLERLELAMLRLIEAAGTADPEELLRLSWIHGLGWDEDSIREALSLVFDEGETP